MSATELPVEPWRRLGALLRSGEMLRVETLGVDAGRVCWVSGTVLAVETVHVAGQLRRHGVAITRRCGAEDLDAGGCVLLLRFITDAIGAAAADDFRARIARGIAHARR